jgi:dihydrolipoamide dehydrogenase
MADSSYDCVVLGSGPGGYVAAIRAAQLGMKTAVVEQDRLGGRCLNYACIPAKAVLRAADVFSEVKDAGEFGVSLNGTEPTVDFESTAKHRDKVVKTLTGGVGSLMKGNGIEVIEGQGAVTSGGNVRVGDDEVEAGSVIIATGSVAKPLLGLEFGERVLDTEHAWALRELPQKMAVIGAGASGSEIASAYGRLGTEVTLLEALPQILPLEDEEIAKAAAREIRKQNVTIVTEANVESAEVSDDGVELRYGGGEAERFDYLAIAAGRGPDVEGLGIADARIETEENGRIEVDDHLRTSVESVWAIGDVVRGQALAHKASDEGILAVEDAADLNPHPLDYNSIPAATFCHPQVASFGMTEKQARDAGYDVVVGKVPMGAVGAPTVYGERTGMIKVVGDSRYGEILGAHMVGAKATDLIAELVVAHDLEGGFAEVARVVHAHPTFSEATMEAARATDGWLIHG